jgi:thymidylate kinase
MQTDRAQFIQSLFRFLSGTEYIWLKAILTRPEDTPPHSDIDLLVQDAAVPGILLFIVGQVSITHCEAKKKDEATYLKIQFQDGTELRLDLLKALVRKQFTYLSNDYLLANRVWLDGVATYSKEVLLEHVLLFAFLNNAGLPQKYVRFFEALPSAEKAQLLAFLHSKYGCEFRDFGQMAYFSIQTQDFIQQQLRRSPENGFIDRLCRLASYAGHLLFPERPWAPSILSFSGVDGAGKTTLLSELRNLFTDRLGLKTVVLRHRPSLLPILSAYTHGRQAAEAKAATTLPRQGTNASRMGSLLRFGYYFSDYLFGQVYVWLRYVLRGYTVIYDRYYFDFIVDAKRSNITLGGALPRKLFRLLAKPGLNILLYADPDTIRQRKKELPHADIVQVTGQYLALFEALKSKNSNQYLCIENHDPAASLAAILAQCFLIKHGNKPSTRKAQALGHQPMEAKVPTGLPTMIELC